MRLGARWRYQLGTACAGLVVAAAAAAQTRVATESELKAAFIYRIALFVEWPAESLPAGAPFQTCVLGSDAAWATAFATIEGKKVQGHAVAPVRLLAQVEEARGCHVLFSPEREARRAAAVPTGVLSIGDGEGFAQSGGAIGFVREGAQLRFDINRDAAARAQLRLPVELLKVARNVIDGGAAKP
jgi:hypothetical protein